MLSQFWPKLVVASLTLIFCVVVVHAWRADRRDRAQLAAELAATHQLLAAADARQHERDAKLTQTLATLAAEKRTVITPAQILRELPKNIPLPAPITLQADRTSSVAAPPLSRAVPRDGSPAPNASSAATPAVDVGARLASPAATTPPSNQEPPANAILPAQDLKPLYDFALDCQACQAKLAAAQGNLTDERQKNVALAKERDDALRIAKGGSAWRRVTRAAKWLIIGAAAGAALSRAH